MFQNKEASIDKRKPDKNSSWKFHLVKNLNTPIDRTRAIFETELDMKPRGAWGPIFVDGGCHPALPK